MTWHPLTARSLLVTLLLAAGLAWAQPLAELAPAEALFTFSYHSQPGVLDTLDDDLAALDWAGARETLLELADFGLARTDDPDVREMLEWLEQMLRAFSDPEAASAEILAFCPDYQTVLDDLRRYTDTRGTDVNYELLETVSVTPFNPIPAVTLILRGYDQDLIPLYENAKETLLTCAQASGEVEVSRLEQGGISFEVADLAGLPLAVTTVDNLLAVSTSPDALRGVLRRVQGSDEPSLADSELQRRAAEVLGDEGFGFSLDFAALAELAEAMGPMMLDGPEAEYLFDRATAALRTMGGLAGRVRATDEGLLVESITAVNPQGGDAQLAELLLCRGCRVSRPALAPAGATRVSGQTLPLRDLFRYLQGWLDDAEALTGESLDLRALLRDELGFDIDRALLDWIGDEYYWLTLEPPSDRLGTLLYGREQVLLIPVTDPAAAEAGLEYWGEALAPLLNELMSDPLSDMSELEGLFTVAADRRYDYRGTEIRRIQAGFNVDLGIAFVGGYMAVGTPAAALEPVIDTYQGAPSLLGSPVLSGLPARTVALHYGDTRAVVGGLADLLGLFSQPAAFAITAALQADGEDGMGDLEPYGFPDLSGATPATLDLQGEAAVGATDQGALSEDMRRDETDTLSAFYELQGLSAGDEVTIELTSNDFDTYLYLIDAAEEAYLAENDDAPDISRSELSFTVQEGVRYWVEVTSWDSAFGYEGGTGGYTLTVTRTPGAAPAAEIPPPAYGDILGLTEILPDVLEVVAAHLGTTEGYSEIRGETIYRRSLTRIDW